MKKKGGETRRAGKHPLKPEGERTTSKTEDKKPERFSIIKKITGLSFPDLIRLRKLKQELASSGKKSGKEISTQQTITFEKMYSDGICRAGRNYYTKMIEFYDINYVLLDEDEQMEILGLYSQLINYCDPSIHFQLFLFNRHVNEEALSAQFEIAPQGDNFDDIREEFSQMLKDLSTKGRNGGTENTRCCK
nr:hypothetical protein [uncultured Butyrivibrio sp.]